MLGGPLTAVDQIRQPEDLSGLSGISISVAYSEGPEGDPPEFEPDSSFWRESPSLIWPQDRSWFVASEVDFDSTLVGGSRELVDALIAHPGLEAYEVKPETLMTAFSDELNPVPKPDDPV